MTSVIVPAHNEEQVIGRCLNSLLSSSNQQPEIIVVCNGCTDRTAEIAREFGSVVTVIETPEASKSLALNLGDRAATAFPRFYLDADVVLSTRALWEVSQVLETEEPRIAVPRMRLVLDDHPWSVRAYYAIWTRLPYARSGVVGSGIYALSRAGRARFQDFPRIIADDEFVRASFSPNETRVVESCHFDAFPPLSLSGIIRTRTRFHKGNLELRARHPDLSAKLRKEYTSAASELIRSPALWPALVVYSLVHALSLALAHWKLRTGQLEWERDEGSRSAAAGTNQDRACMNRGRP